MRLCTRQVYYAARPTILTMTGNDKLASNYFTQTILPRYLDEHPEKTAAWDIVYDARGHLTEPHTGRLVALGTLDVRGYLVVRRRRKIPVDPVPSCAPTGTQAKATKRPAPATAGAG